ncbi:MAG: ribonuclease H-like domain-containing protein [Stenotrophomonas sp.]|uniref:ribonuclease H-like domain-containing protein n=1 Tax=Stenotrophomonas sp. TaxID=69392 RepID=UPI003D6D24F6
MSISLDKLKALRKQAGHAEKPAGDSPVGAALAAKPMQVNADSESAIAARASSAADALPASRPRPLLQGREESVFGWVDGIQHKPAAPVRRAQDGDALRRLLATRNRAVAPAPRAERNGPIDRALPGVEIAPGLHLIEAFLPQPIPAQPLSLAFSKRPEEHVQARDLLFFDTETTGLAGGTGTRAFMIGAADWTHDSTRGEGLRVRQLLMSTMGAESAMLDVFSGWLSASTVLSSYNGRSYDSPLLKTRYRLARRGDPISPLDHVDLLYPTRRRYRGTWENCRLATIERNLLQIAREDDLPGSEAPAAWLGYLRGGSARNLRRVGEHNHQDVVTLAQLFLRLVQEDADEREELGLGEER